MSEKQKALFVTAPQPTLKRVADLEGPDFYPTPAWATRALIENETFEGDVWECACGNGAMSDQFKEYGYEVHSSDLYDRGYGEKDCDFLNSNKTASNIVTNPPFHSAEEFVHKGLELAQNKLALLLRLAFLEGGKRQANIFNVYPPTRVWVFSERITFYPAGSVRKGSGTTAYAWFVWDKNHLGKSELKWLPTGYKKRFG
ncbi:NAD(P)-dependent oxidoreductase [Donghicola sp. XS_ASV15]|uniref:NAD(P)-dependent oxidoreductase n=1 Tax=Donghicola sp. XS_ASV15 TaxID=3241295 RepID=UPI00351532FE